MAFPTLLKCSYLFCQFQNHAPVGISLHSQPVRNLCYIKTFTLSQQITILDIYTHWHLNIGFLTQNCGQTKLQEGRHVRIILLGFTC